MLGVCDPVVQWFGGGAFKAMEHCARLGITEVAECGGVPTTDACTAGLCPLSASGRRHEPWAASGYPTRDFGELRLCGAKAQQRSDGVGHVNGGGEVGVGGGDGRPRVDGFRGVERSDVGNAFASPSGDGVMDGLPDGGG